MNNNITTPFLGISAQSNRSSISNETDSISISSLLDRNKLFETENNNPYTLNMSENRKEFMKTFENELIEDFKTYIFENDEKTLKNIFLEKNVYHENYRALVRESNRNNSYIEIELHIENSYLFLLDKKNMQIIEIFHLRGCFINCVNFDYDSLYRHNFRIGNSKKSSTLYFVNSRFMLNFYNKIEKFVYKFDFENKWQKQDIVQVSNNGNYYCAVPLNRDDCEKKEKTLIKMISFKKCNENKQIFNNIINEILLNDKFEDSEDLIKINYIWISDASIIFEYTLKAENILPMSC